MCLKSMAKSYTKANAENQQKNETPLSLNLIFFPLFWTPTAD